LIFEHKSVLEYHLREDHPDVHFDYPIEKAGNSEWPLAQEPRRYTWRPTYPVRRIP
jgi:hypothetical protein